jgi:leader peptidase (prepilin peptidase)/N-methyltransferase
MGEGDRELLAFIGAFTGICGAWVSLMIGSIAGSIVGIVYLYATGQGKNTRIPFGPFLAGGAIVYVLCQESIVNYFCTGF